ncbi:FAD-dependent oxidoreductase [Pseudonocardia alni]|uniref:FAD-dependent oxidoreductase n=1 Tax=Pseudonocardia alni TaxID=33907 RepID=UPI00331DFD33
MDATVLVVGAGYAGVAAANRIAAGGAAVTVVDPREEFVERVRLHRLAAGTGAATVPLREVLHRRVRTRAARVIRIGDGTATLDDGDVLRFDRLVYAVGSGAGTAPDGALRVDTLESARRVHDAAAALPGGAVVAVVGAGLTGLETAAELAAARPGLRVRLLSAGPVAAELPARSRDRVRARLASLGVEVGEGVTVTDPAALGAGLVVWTTTPAVPGWPGTPACPSTATAACAPTPRSPAPATPGSSVRATPSRPRRRSGWSARAARPPSRSGSPRHAPCSRACADAPHRRPRCPTPRSAWRSGRTPR